jgi:Tol biopolymer transport system component
VADNGTLVYVPGTGASSERELLLLDESGRSGPPLLVGAYESLALSPDETRIAISTRSPAGADIWVSDLTRGDRIRLTDHPAYDARRCGAVTAPASSSRPSGTAARS